ncbi:MAG: hypothetical protein WBW62_09140 [Solirubrobacterales bacterium]
MSRIKKHLSFSNVIAALALFIALGGSAYAVGKNSVGTKQIKNNAVTAKKIKKNSVVTSKIKKNAVTTAKIKNGAVNGSKVDVASLPTVPSAAISETANSAATATEAANLAGQKSFFIKLEGGQSAVIDQYGVVALRATCVVDESGDDIISITAETTQDGAILAGDDTLTGGANADDFLNVNTLEDDRVFEVEYDDTGETYVDSEIDSGFVLGPDGKAIVANTEGLILGLNYLGSRCIVGGITNHVG